MPETGAIFISHDFKLDLLWWKIVLPHYNGISMMSEDWVAADELLAVDACLTGCG